MERQPVQPHQKETLPAQAERPSGALRSVGAGLGYFGLYLLVQLVVSLFAMLVVAIVSVRSVGVSDVGALMADVAARIQDAAMLLTLVVNAAVLAAVYLMFRIRGKRPLAEIRLTRVPLVRLLPLIPLGLALNVLLSSLIALLPASWLAAYEEASGAVLGGGLDAFAALMVAVVAPLAEEVLFRGLVYTRFARALPRWLAMAASALLFGSMHMQPVWMAYAAVLGVLLCVMLERYRSLWAAIVLHMSFNAGSFFVLLLDGVSVATLIPFCAALVTGILIAVFRQTGAEEAGRA